MNLPNLKRVVGRAVLLAACSFGCGEPAANLAEGFPAESLVSALSDDGSLRLEMRTSPSQPPERGTLRVELRVSETSTNAPRNDLSLEVTPWMPAMGHGSSVRPSVVSKGEGVYELSGVSVYMPGTWELRTVLRDAGSHSATSVTISVDVL